MTSSSLQMRRRKCQLCSHRLHLWDCLGAEEMPISRVYRNLAVSFGDICCESESAFTHRCLLSHQPIKVSRNLAPSQPGSFVDLYPICTVEQYSCGNNSTRFVFLLSSPVRQPQD